MSDPTEPEHPPGGLRRGRTPLLAVSFLLACALAVRAEEPPPFAAFEKQSFELVNQDRAAQGKAPYQYDDGLAAVARAHSLDMLENRFFGHESPRTGGIGRRLAAAKVRVTASGENLAMSRTIKAAHADLMKSPGHRENMLHDLFTHCGVGIARASNALYYVTQVFAAPAPVIDPAQAVPDLLEKLNRARVARGKLPFRVSPALNRIAAQYAAQVAKAGKQIPADLSRQALDAGVRHRRLSIACLVAWDPGHVIRADALFEPVAGFLGLGLAENTDYEELGVGIYWAVVVFTSD